MPKSWQQKRLEKDRRSANRWYGLLRKRGVYPFEIKSYRKEHGLKKLSFYEIHLLLDAKLNPWDWNQPKVTLYAHLLKSVWPQDQLYSLLYDGSWFQCMNGMVYVGIPQKSDSLSKVAKLT